MIGSYDESAFLRYPADALSTQAEKQLHCNAQEWNDEAIDEDTHPSVALNSLLILHFTSWARKR
jgi:hypothetical protein